MMVSRFQLRVRLLGMASAAFLALSLAATSPAWASELTHDEMVRLASMAAERGAGELTEAEVLHNRFGEDSFIVGYTQDSYLIVDRGTFAFLEQGPAPGPYEGCEGSKYYGGFRCYAELQNGTLYDLSTGEPMENLAYLPAMDELIEKYEREEGLPLPGSRMATSSGTLPKSNEIVKRMAFGLNAGEYDNTCSAVALGLALGYLDVTFDSRLVPSDMEPESRVSADYSSSRYPKATKLHHCLVDECGMAPGLLGLWGADVEAGLDSYMRADSERSAAGVEMAWTVTDLNRTLVDLVWLREGIKNGRPLLITTIVDWWVDDHAIDYSTHTMLVYGFRTASDGTTEVNAHPGWYGSGHSSNDGVVNDVWLPLDIAAMAYTFSLSDGWHYSGEGNWKYYEDGSYATGWKTIDGNRYYFSSSGVRTTGYLTLGTTRYLFNGDGVLVSQSSIWSPSTGVEDLTAEEVAEQIASQYTQQSIPLERVETAFSYAKAANPEVVAWLYVPGTNVSLPVCRREGDDAYYLDHDSKRRDSVLGAAYMEQADSAAFDQALTVLYGHSFINQNLMFTGLHAFEDEAFFREHECIYVLTVGGWLAYRVIEAAYYTDGHIAGMADESDAASVQAYFDAFDDDDPEGFIGFRRPCELDADTDRVLQLSTCTVPAADGARFVVSAMLVESGAHEVDL